MSETPLSHQKLKADARNSAATAPSADPETAARAVAEAEGVKPGKSRVQPVYKTQGDVAGENVHRDKDAVISEFDDPAGNTV